MPILAQQREADKPGLIWVVERNQALNTLMLQRSAIVLQQMRNAGFYPTVDYGNSVPNGHDAEALCAIDHTRRSWRSHW